MNKPWLWLVLALCPLSILGNRLLRSAPEQSAATAKPQPHRSPMDVAVLPDGKRALTANHTADTVSLVDLAAGKVLAEQAVGHRPAGVACSRDGKRAVVSNLWSGTLTLLDVQDAGLQTAATVPIGAGPRSVLFAPDGATLYVALAVGNEVVQFDWQSRKVLRRWSAAMEPRNLALTRDGRYLAASSARTAQVRCWDTQTGQRLWERDIVDAFNLHGLAFSPDGKELVTGHIHDRHHAINKHNIEEGWALDNRLSRLTREPDARTQYWQIALDTRGQAAADPCAVAFSSGGDWMTVCAAGTHELLVFKNSTVPWGSGDPGDLIDSRLAIDATRFRRVDLGGRPLAVQFLGDSDQAVVANYLLDALQIVDAKTGKIVRQIALGGPEKPAAARQGEALFYDAKRSHHQWFSCNSCHPDGHTNGKLFDTLNDDSFGNPKLSPSLRAVSKTGPWTWHGWQKDLGAAVEKSLVDTLYGPKPSADEVKAMVAFLETLDHPPNPNRKADGSLTEAAERGKLIFEGKGRCARCHHGEQYTSDKNYDVKIEADDSPYRLWNPPTLRGVHDRGPFLHDGRADTLDEVLRDAHAPQKLGAAELTPEERKDLIEFLKSL